MPTYEFRCDNCKVNNIFFKSAEEVCKMTNGFNIVCKCGTKMYQVFDTVAFKFKGEPPAGRAIQLKHEAQRQEEIYAEGFSSETERKEAFEMAAEEEKRRGKTPGTLTNGVIAPTTPLQKEAVKRRCEKKKASAQRARRKVVL